MNPKAKEPSTAPPAGQWFLLTLGSTLRKPSPSSRFYSLRYEFKPASIDTTRPGSLFKSNDNKVTVEFCNNQTGKPKVSFQGNSQDCKELDAIIFFDGKSFRLERLHRAVKSLRHLRLPGESAGAANVTTTAGGAGTIVGALAVEPTSSPGHHQEHESEMKEIEDKISINRAPVLTMWVAVVATREGFTYEEGLSFGKAIARLMAQSKGRSLGVYEEPSEEKKGERKRKRKELDRYIVSGMNVPGKRTQDGLLLALQSGKPISQVKTPTRVEELIALESAAAAVAGLLTERGERKLGCNYGSAACCNEKGM